MGKPQLMNSTESSLRSKKIDFRYEAVDIKGLDYQEMLMLRVRFKQ